LRYFKTKNKKDTEFLFYILKLAIITTSNLLE